MGEEQGTQYKRYEWTETDGMQTHRTGRLFVGPATKLIRFSNEIRVVENGDEHFGAAVVEYPTTTAAELRAPKFPRSLKFRTLKEMLADFHRRIVKSDQHKTVGGIRTDLYGVIINSNVPEGLSVDVITRGGVAPEVGSAHRPEDLGIKLLPERRSSRLPLNSDPATALFGREQAIETRRYIVNQSDDLLYRAPDRITVRVPVWRLDRSSTSIGGKLDPQRKFVGYVTFTTSKIFVNLGASELNYYQ